MIRKNNNVLIILFSILIFIIVIIFCCSSCFRVDNFADLSCEAIQNKYYHIDELIYKSKCPNLVILEKLVNNKIAFFAELGDENGPYFSKDHINFYYMGISPRGETIDLNYDLYYMPVWNPIRWFAHSPYQFRRRRPRRRRKKYYFADDEDYYNVNDSYNPWENANISNKKPMKNIKKNVKFSKDTNFKNVRNQKKNTLKGASARL